MLNLEAKDEVLRLCDEAQSSILLTFACSIPRTCLVDGHFGDTRGSSNGVAVAASTIGGVRRHQCSHHRQGGGMVEAVVQCVCGDTGQMAE